MKMKDLLPQLNEGTDDKRAKRIEKAMEKLDKISSQLENMYGKWDGVLGPISDELLDLELETAMRSVDKANQAFETGVQSAVSYLTDAWGSLNSASKRL